MYDPFYLHAVGKIVASEGPMTQEQFRVVAHHWLPEKRNKDKVLLFPLQEDWDFAWVSYRNELRIRQRGIVYA